MKNDINIDDALEDSKIIQRQELLDKYDVAEVSEGSDYPRILALYHELGGGPRIENRLDILLDSHDLNQINRLDEVQKIKDYLEAKYGRKVCVNRGNFDKYIVE
ncbi:hypothetical protein [Lactiplantibacillus plantarum]|uniref:hypothetical protein n=1 Tax=Lactiplantibacillus plantarum TaxID=1590 RepID=UPI001BAE34A3|nr:hypothetical protein [Lactiplantibacillus plantarum]MBS0955636.1 hypothetical protein [Lactiplantibacillus plantarum]